MDIHGQKHPEGWIELGYLLTSTDLSNLNSNLTKKSSINKLVLLSNQTFDELIRGNNYSLGGIIQNKYNFNVVPSPNNPKPSTGANYYSGGFISKNFTSPDRSMYRLNAIQMELPYVLRTNNVVDNAKKLADCIYEYYVRNSFGNKNSKKIYPK